MNKIDEPKSCFDLSEDDQKAIIERVASAASEEHKAMTQSNKSMSERFDDMNRNCDGAYGCGKFPPEVLKFVEKEIQSALTKRNAEIAEMIKNKRWLPLMGVAFKESEMPAIDAKIECINRHNEEIDDLLSTITKEKK